ncbi:MAG: hypothetical protein WBG96_21215 [Thermoanaerobaculia bacterium]
MIHFDGKCCFWFCFVVFAFGVESGCARKVEITSNSASSVLDGKCIEIQEPVFLIKVEEGEIDFPEVSQVRLAPPGSLFAPSGDSTFEVGAEGFDPTVERLSIVRSGTQFQVERVWSLQFFDGDSLVVLARIPTDNRGLVVADVSELVHELWAIDLADGEISAMERKELAGKHVLDKRFAEFCVQ